MNPALVRARPELRLLWLSIGSGVFFAVLLAMVFGMLVGMPEPTEALEVQLLIVPLLSIGACGLYWAPVARVRWTAFDKALPVTPRERFRARVLAAWIATLLPTVPAWLLLWVLSPVVRELMGQELVVGAAALLLFATLYATEAAGRSVAPWWLFLVATVAAVVAVVVGLRFSAAGALIASLAVSGGLVARHWFREPAEHEEIPSPPARGYPLWLSPRLLLDAALVALFGLNLSLQSGGGTANGWIWLPFVLGMLFDMVLWLLRPLRVIGSLPLDRRRYALRAGLLPLSVLVITMPLALPLVDWSGVRSHRGGHIDLERNEAVPGYRAEIRPPLGAYRLAWAGSVGAVVRDDGSTLDLDLEQEPVGFGLVRINPYSVGDGATYEQSLAAAERLVRDLYGPDAPVERIPQRMLERNRYDPGGAPRSQDPVTGTYDADVFDVVFADQPRPSRRYGFATVWLVLFGLWMLATWAGTVPRTFPRRRVHPMGRNLMILIAIGLAVTQAAFTYAELAAVAIWRIGQIVWQPATVPVLAVVVVLHMRWIQRRVERMEAFPLAMDKQRNPLSSTR